MGYLSHLLGVMLPQMAVIVGLHVLHRRGALTSVSQAAICGVGAYVWVVFTYLYHWSSLTSLVLAFLAGGLSSVLFATGLVGRARGFVLQSVVIQLLFVAVLHAFQRLGGEGGIRTTPERPTIAGSAFVASVPFVVTVSVAVILVLIWVDGSRLGLAARAVADDPQLSAGLGLRPWFVRCLLLVIVNSFTAFVGAMAAAFRQGVSPDDFGLDRSILYLAAAALAPSRSCVGALLSGGALLLGAEGLQLILPGTAGTRIFFGLLIIAAVALEARNE